MKKNDGLPSTRYEVISRQSGAGAGAGILLLDDEGFGGYELNSTGFYSSISEVGTPYHQLPQTGSLDLSTNVRLLADSSSDHLCAVGFTEHLLTSLTGS